MEKDNNNAKSPNINLKKTIASFYYKVMQLTQCIKSYMEFFNYIHFNYKWRQNNDKFIIFTPLLEKHSDPETKISSAWTVFLIN